MKEFRGTGVAIITPFKIDGSIDFEALGSVIEHIISNKMEYIVSLGTTGESATLSKKEKESVLDFTVKTINKRVPIVAGFGGNNTAEVIESIKNYSFNGIDAILSVSPYYNKPTQQGIYEHYMAIDAIAPRPVILYNVPSRTSSNVAAQTTLRLAKDSKNIKAVKEASGDLVQCMEIVQNKPKDFLVLSGDDALTLPMLGIGMDGLISVIGNGFPFEISEMVRCGLKGDFTTAQKYHYKLLNMMELIFKEGNPAGIKAALAEMGLCENKVRLPLAAISEQLNTSIKSETANITNKVTTDALISSK